MSLKVRLSVICLLFTGVIALVATIGYRGSQTLIQSLNNVAQTQMPAIRNMTLVDMMHDGLRAVVFRALYLAESEMGDEKKEVAEELKEMSSNLKKYIDNIRTLSLAPETKKAISDVLPAVDNYVLLAEKVTVYALAGKKDLAAQQLTEFQKSFKFLEARLEELGELIEKDAGQINYEGKDTAQQILIFSLLGVFFGFVVSVWVVMVLTKTLTQIFDGIKQVSVELNQTSDGLAQASQQLASSSQEQASSVVETSSSLEEISGMVTSALKGAEQSVELSGKVSDLVNQGTESMTALQNSVNQIAEANARVEKLGKLIEEIGEKTELIDEIVFQTRLLSFNASVEAERAGEHGRGFAVVAQEVGNLAQMSGKSASEIGNIVKNSIREAREVVDLNRAKVEMGVQLCQKTATQLQAIESASKEIMSGAEKILRSSEEQNAGVQQINQSIQMISQTTQENATSAEECSQGSQSLTNQGHSLLTAISSLGQLVYGGRGREEKIHSKTPVAAVQQPVKKLKKQQPVFGNLALKDPWDKI